MEASNSSSSSAERKQNRKASLKKALFAHFNQKNKSCRSKLVSRAAAIARAKSFNGIDVFSQSTQEDNGAAVRLKIVVMKEDLEEVLELMRNYNDNNNNPNTADDDNGDDDEEDEEALLSMDERLIQWRKNHRRHNSWNPTLQTIPEEILA